MTKREVAADIDVGVPRPKRRRGSQHDSPEAEDVDMADAGASSEQDEVEAVDETEMSPEEVREHGLRVWQAMRDLVDKDGRPLTTDFLRLPPKKQYPDYYDFIKKPIALEEIKSQIETNGYGSLQDLRSDFGQCFGNAKRYNIRESKIWRDAKTLHKFSNKEIDKIIHQGDGEDGEGSEGEGKKKKEKGTNIARLMKNRLQKLTAKEDDSGRVLSLVFMDLPLKRKWAIYYKIIAKPICIEDIFKRIKRKEYDTIPDFMSDVDLVFDNAMHFNEEHSEIWEDALTLKTYFHQIMTDLPARYGAKGTGDVDPSASPELVNKKIMLKLPQQRGKEDAKAATPLQNNNMNGTVVGSVLLNTAPAGGAAGGGADGARGADGVNGVGGPSVKKGSKSPAMPAATMPPTTSTPLPMPTKVVPPTTQAKATYTGLQPAFSASVPPPYGGSHYTPHAYYGPPAAAAAGKAGMPATSTTTPAPVRTSATPAPVAGTSSSHSSTPFTPISTAAAGMRSVRLVTHPLGRKLDLDSKEGVRSWAMRLGGTEYKVVIRDVRFAVDDEGGSDSEGGGDEIINIDDDERMGDNGLDQVAQRTKRARGRPRRAAALKKDTAEKTKNGKQKGGVFVTMSSPSSAGKTSTSSKRKQASSSTPTVEEVLVRLDGMQVTPKSDSNATGEWSVEVAAGNHILEVGKKGNDVLWKVYVERRAS